MSTTLASLSSLADMVLVQLPGCTYPLALEGLKQAARDFLRRSGLWREDIALATADGTLVYDLDVPEGALIEALVALEDDQENILDATTAEFAPPDRLIFAADPGTKDYVADVLCIPSGAEVPDWLLASHGDALRAGAVASRKRDAGKPWSAQDWPLWQQQYEDAVRFAITRQRGSYNGRFSTALQGVQVR